MDDPSLKQVAQARPGTTRARRVKLLISYAPDWILTIVIAGLFYLLDRLKGFYRDFSLNDESIQFHYTTQERVPMWLLLVIALVCPVVIMPLINVLTIRSFWDLHNSWLGLALAFALTGSITNIVKLTVGRPRPDLIARCQPTPGSHDAPVYGLVSYKICQQTDLSILNDGFRSFFSGHSSLSFAGLGFLFFYTAGKMHLFDHRGQTGKTWICAVPLVAATLVAISRTMDYRHHWHDVLIGGIVGLVTAHFSYRQYYPPLNHPLSHEPYSPRIPAEEEIAQKKNDEIPLASIPGAPGSQRSGSIQGQEVVAPTSAELGLEGTVQRQSIDLSDTWKASQAHQRTGSKSVV